MTERLFEEEVKMFKLISFHNLPKSRHFKVSCNINATYLVEFSNKNQCYEIKEPTKIRAVSTKVIITNDVLGSTSLLFSFTLGDKSHSCVYWSAPNCSLSKFYTFTRTCFCNILRCGSIGNLNNV